MTYKPDIPIASIPPITQAPEILTNFSQFATVFAINHVAINSDNQGDHNAIVMMNQTSDPGVTQDLDVLYSKNATSKAGTQPQLFLQIPKYLPSDLDPSSVGSIPMQLTYNQVNTSGPVYQSFLPGGFLMYFGSITNIAIPITLSPAPTKILAAIAFANTLVTTTGAPFTVSTQILSNSQFQINSALNVGGPPISYSFTWMAIASA